MAQRTFKTPRTRLKLLDRNFSTRDHPVSGTQVLALAIHTTESHDIPNSAADVAAIYNWFNDPRSQASSHFILDSDGRSWQIVPLKQKAWTIGAANSFTINYELVGFAAWNPLQWEGAIRMLKKLAQHLAHEAKLHNIPLEKGRVENIGGVCVCTKPGVITHRMVTQAGFGTHSDPGIFFPLRAVLRMARWYQTHGWFEGPAR